MNNSRKCLIEAGDRLKSVSSDFVRGALLLLVGFYRLLGTNHFGGCCRFEPSCSEYAVDALHRHAPWTATRLILARVLRCRPGQIWGYDPVPDAPGRKR